MRWGGELCKILCKDQGRVFNVRWLLGEVIGKERVWVGAG